MRWTVVDQVFVIVFLLLAGLSALAMILMQDEMHPFESPNPYVVWCERLWIGPQNPDHVVVMVWSDGEIWTAYTDHLDAWQPLVTVRTE